MPSMPHHSPVIAAQLELTSKKEASNMRKERATRALIMISKTKTVVLFRKKGRKRAFRHRLYRVAAVSAPDGCEARTPRTFVSFVASRPGVSRRARAVTVTARNARRFVRHGVSTTSWAPQRRPRLYINHFGHPAAALRPPALLVLTPPSFTSAQARHTRTAPSALFSGSRTCVRCASPCC